MGKEYVCEKCGATYDRLAIDWPGFCSRECALANALVYGATDRSSPASHKGNGRAE
jgi:hypothetical protein